MALEALRVVVLLLLLAEIMGHPRELLVDEDSPPAKVKSLRTEDDEVMEEGTPCHMEYQVMKRVVGSCIKLGRTTRACVAGNYLHPLHPECM